jgi:hypothetical protein
LLVHWPSGGNVSLMSSVVVKSKSVVVSGGAVENVAKPVSFGTDVDPGTVPVLSSAVVTGTPVVVPTPPVESSPDSPLGSCTLGPHPANTNTIKLRRTTDRSYHVQICSWRT